DRFGSHLAREGTAQVGALRQELGLGAGLRRGVGALELGADARDDGRLGRGAQLAAAVLHGGEALAGHAGLGARGGGAVALGLEALLEVRDLGACLLGLALGLCAHGPRRLTHLLGLSGEAARLRRGAASDADRVLPEAGGPLARLWKDAIGV